MRPEADPNSTAFATPDARWKLVVCFAFVIAGVLTPIGRWWIFASFGVALAIVLVAIRVSPRVLIARWLHFLLLVASIAVAVGFSHARRGEHGTWVIVASILIKNSLAFGALFALAHTTSHQEMLVGLGRLGLPRPIVATLQFMHRSLFILKDELERMTRARRSRSFARHPWTQWGSLAGLLGRLFLRSFERSERVHSAMLSRGWDGTVRTLDGADVS